MKRFVSVTAWLIHNNYQSESIVGKIYGKPHPRSLVKGFVKMTEKNYVIKEDPSKHETLNQCWADVVPASQTLGQQQPSIGSMSRVCRDGFVSSGYSFGHSFGGGPPAKTGHWALCWFNVGPSSATLAQHWNNTRAMSRVCWGVLMAPIAVLLYTELDEGWQTSLCVYTYA